MAWFGRCLMSQVLHLAARNKARKVVRALLQLGADPLWESKDNKFFFECWPSNVRVDVFMEKAGGAKKEKQYRINVNEGP